MNKIGNSSLNNINKDGFNPILREFLLEIMPISPIDFSVVSTIRTQKEQEELYKQGRTVKFDKQGNRLPVVTQLDGVTKKSNHQLKAISLAMTNALSKLYPEKVIGFKQCGIGNAFDAIPYPKGYESSDVEFVKLSTFIKASFDHFCSKKNIVGLEIAWGGDWNGGWDKPHYELIDKK